MIEARQSVEILGRNRLDAWQVIGPGGAGGMFLPTVSPHDPQLVLEHCDMTGAYISHDAGRSWRKFNLRGAISAFAFDPRAVEDLVMEVRVER